MEANEINSQAVMFIKKYGWDKVKEVVDSIKIKVSFDGRACHPCFITETGDYVSCNELEPFVKSYKLVESYGGLEKAKIRCYPAKHVTMESYYKLKQAIKDVESCL